MSQTENYDAIVIGSGISGLTVANLLAQVAGKRVLVLEQHYQVGGYTHAFSRKGYSWDVGLHYVGRMHPGALPRVLSDFLSAGKLRWNRIESPFEQFVYPDFTFAVPTDPRAYRRQLQEQFPSQHRQIARYFADIGQVSSWFVRYLLSNLFGMFLRNLFLKVNWFARRNVRLTTAEYFESRFSDPRLVALLASQWGNYGLPPSRSAFVVHSIVVNHFLKGGYYPDKGSSEIATHFVPPIVQRGGEVLTCHEAVEIGVEKGAVTGVRVRTAHGQERFFRSPVVVSSAGALTTFKRLLPPAVALPFREKLDKMQSGTCTVSLYLGLKDTPAKLGFRGSNYWISDSYDHDKMFDDKEVLSGKPAACYLSFPSLKDPHTDKHTATAIAYVDYESFRRWSAGLPGKREKEYYDFKEQISQGIIDFIDRHYPGFAALIDYQELGTPLSTEHFTGHHEGAMYGLSAGVQRYRENWLSVCTPVKGLYMTGTDVASLGVVGAMMGGLVTAALLCGPIGLFKIVGSARLYALKLKLGLKAKTARGARP